MILQLYIGLLYIIEYVCVLPRGEQAEYKISQSLQSRFAKARHSISYTHLCHLQGC